MKNIKSVLALLVAVCLMMCLAVPTFATETTGSAETTVETTGSAETTAETTAAAEETTGAAEDTTAAADETTGAAEDTTGATEETEAAKETEDHDHDHEEDTTTTGTSNSTKTESGFKKVIRVILIVLEVIASLVLILVVLFQSGKEAGLSGVLSGNADTYLSKNGGSLDKMLATATKWVALAWIVITLLLSFL